MRAIADGVVKQIIDELEALAGDMYGVAVDIEHGDKGSGMSSTFGRVKVNPVSWQGVGP